MRPECTEGLAEDLQKDAHNLLMILDGGGGVCDPCTGWNPVDYLMCTLVLASCRRLRHLIVGEKLIRLRNSVAMRIQFLSLRLPYALMAA
jgi:hypothetical protein